ncbi:MAG: hypothetical protein JNK38_00440 [Acidobacteria bacterium]|nr:hypothetical protein [Acidobacteriota bacterium]
MILLLAAVVFAGAFGLYRFHDDWTFAYKAQEALSKGRPLDFILRPLEQHWSPLWHLTEIVNARVAGWESDTFLRGFILVTFLGSLMLLVVLGRWLGLTTFSICTGLVVFGVHPIAAVPRYSFDCYSQCAADLLVWGAAVVLLKILPGIDGKLLPKSQLFGFFGLLAVGLLFKEQALSGFAVSAWVLAVFFHRFRLSKARRDALLILVGLILLAGAFTFVRARTGVMTATSGPFQISILNAPVNKVILLGGLISPIPLLKWFDALRAEPRQVGLLAIYAVTMLSALGYLVGGLFFRWKLVSEQRFQLWLVAGALIFSGFPTALLAHVGELYAHTGLFWFAALAALATEGWRIRFQNRLGQQFVWATVLVWGMIMAIGLRGLLAEMRATGERSRQWVTRSNKLLASLPTGSFVVVDALQPAKLPTDHSLLRLSRPQYLILTGIRPWAFRLLTNDTITVVLREGIEKRENWRQELAERQQESLSYQLWIGDNEIRLHRCEDSGCRPSN